MDEYIERGQALDKFIEGDGNDAFTEGYNFAVNEYREKIKAMPSADVQPVKHGKWEEIEEYGGWGDTYFRCSICGDKWDLDTGTPVENGMKYCPNCGARMDGDANE